MPSAMATMFMVRMRAYSAAQFDYADFVRLAWSDAEALLLSEYTGGPEGHSYGVTIHGAIRGPGDSMDEAQRRMSQALGDTFPSIALSSNGAVATPLMVAAHGLDLTDAQPFIGYRTPEAWDWFPPGKRRIDGEATHALISSLITNQGSQLLRQAIEFYSQALGHWTPEERLLAGEFLSIAAETLSRYLLESRAAARGMTPKNLARLFNSKDVESLRRQFLVDEIFARDLDALTALQEASNGFEHGYMAANQVRGVFEPVLERSMGHVRRALIEASGVDGGIQRRLLADEYTEPRGLVPDIWLISGQLSRRDPSKPAPPIDEVRIELEWTKGKPVATTTDSGDVSIGIPWEVKIAHKPDDVSLDLSGVGVRAAHVRQTTTGPLEVKVKPGGAVLPTQPADASSTDAGPPEE